MSATVRTRHAPSGGSGGPDVRRAPRRAVLLLAGLLLGLALAVRLFVVEPFYVPSSSMAPTLRPGDHAVAFKLAYRLGSPRPGDVVVLRNPQDRGDLLIKRVVATAGQRLEVRDGVLFVDGRRRREGYVDYGRVDSTFFGPVRVPAGQVFVLGDNRANSADSRTFGGVPVGDLVGRVFAGLDLPLP